MLNHQLSSSNLGADGNAYVSELNSSGQLILGVVLGHGGTTQPAGIAVDASGDIYTTYQGQ